MVESTDFFRDRGILRKKADFLTNLRIFFVLSSATTPPPDFRLAVGPMSRAPSESLRLRRVNFFGYYPKSQDFSEFRLGNPDNIIVNAKEL